MDTKLGKVMTYCERLPPLKPYDPLKKIYMSTFTRLMATKLGKALTLGRRFSTQTPKSSPTSCFFFISFG